MPQKTHTMHGRDHLPGGADPIPGLGAPSDSCDGTRIGHHHLWAYYPLHDTAFDALDHDYGAMEAHLDPVGSPTSTGIAGPIEHPFEDGGLPSRSGSAAHPPPAITGSSFHDTAGAAGGFAEFGAFAWIWIDPLVSASGSRRDSVACRSSATSTPSSAAAVLYIAHNVGGNAHPHAAATAAPATPLIGPAIP